MQNYSLYTCTNCLSIINTEKILINLSRIRTLSTISPPNLNHFLAINANEVLLEAIGNSAICMASLSTLSLDELTTLYDTELRKLIDALAPTKTRTITIRPESIREAKQTRRQAERPWRKTGLVVHREMYVEKRDMVNVLIDQEKTHHYQSIIAENQGNTKQLFSVVLLLLGKSKTTPLPSNKSASE